MATSSGVPHAITVPPPSPPSVLVASTGVIGKQIPIDKIAAGVEMLKPQLAVYKNSSEKTKTGPERV